MQTVNLEKLPPQARTELLDFYEFLLQKYMTTQTTSRWQKVAQRVHDDNCYPSGWSEQLKQDMRDFRENCNFKHDEI
jgi:hypothetical protein